MLVLIILFGILATDNLQLHTMLPMFMWEVKDDGTRVPNKFWAIFITSIPIGLIYYLMCGSIETVLGTFAIANVLYPMIVKTIKNKLKNYDNSKEKS